MGRELRDPVHPVPELTVRPSVAADIEPLARNLRRADRDEIAANTGADPVDAIGRGFVASSPCFTVEYKGEPAAMFGVVPSDETTSPRLGSIWLLGTDAIQAFSMDFLRYSHDWLATACKDYDIVGNVVDARNTTHLRWLRWLGFRFLVKHEKYGVEGRAFFEFAKIVPKEGDPRV
jgi:hypothetical protein